MIKYVIIALISGIFSAFSQILLKQGSNKKHNTWFSEYINPYVIVGYGIVFVCMILMMLAYKGLPYKYGAILEALVYLYLMVLSRLILKERITKKRLLGNLLIVCGVAVFVL